MLKCTVDDCTNDRADQNPKATNRHCRQHQAETQAKYKATLLDQKHGKGFSEGVSAMRDCLADAFNQVGSGSYDGYEIAALIRKAPGPLPIA